eukprot:6457449-Amphidinium_carterae.2
MVIVGRARSKCTCIARIDSRTMWTCARLVARRLKPQLKQNKPLPCGIELVVKELLDTRDCRQTFDLLDSYTPEGHK